MGRMTTIPLRHLAVPHQPYPETARAKVCVNQTPPWWLLDLRIPLKFAFRYTENPALNERDLLYIALSSRLQPYPIVPDEPDGLPPVNEFDGGQKNVRNDI
jgi:hypothetical protein